MGDSIYVLLGLIVLAFPVAAIVAISMTLGTRPRVRFLESRLDDFERRFASADRVRRTVRSRGSVRTRTAGASKAGR
jgi:hypothetical protein